MAFIELTRHGSPAHRPVTVNTRNITTVSTQSEDGQTFTEITLVGGPYAPARVRVTESYAQVWSLLTAVE